MAQECDRCNRVAKVRIQAVQNLVAATFADRANSDPLFEADALEELSLSFSGGKPQLKNSRLSISGSCRAGGLLSSQGPPKKSRQEQSRGWTWEKCNNVKKRRRRRNEKRRRKLKVGGSSKRGTSTGHPSWATNPVRRAGPSRSPSRKVSTSPRARRKTSSRLLHLLGSCCMIPGIDNPTLSYAGEKVPQQAFLP